MTYTLIGTGNMAWFLTKRFYAQGYTCAGVYGRNKDKATVLANSVHTHTFDTPGELPEADCCVIAISDRSIHEVSKNIALKNTVVIHTAGAVPLEAIVQNNSAVLWTIYSINRDNLPEHRNLPVVYESNSEKAIQVVRKLAYALSDIVKQVDWQQRQWLHLCAVLGNNFTNHLMAICEVICREQDLAFSLVRPIILQTFEGIASIEPTLIQTGPAVRKDHTTVQSHLHLLAKNPHWQKVYQSLSASIEDMYNSEGGKKEANN